MVKLWLYTFKKCNFNDSFLAVIKTGAKAKLGLELLERINFGILGAYGLQMYPLFLVSDLQGTKCFFCYFHYVLVGKLCKSIYEGCF